MDIAVALGVVMSCYSFVYLFVMFYYVIKNTCLSV